MLLSFERGGGASKSFRDTDMHGSGKVQYIHVLNLYAMYAVRHPPIWRKVNAQFSIIHWSRDNRERDNKKNKIN